MLPDKPFPSIKSDEEPPIIVGKYYATLRFRELKKLLRCSRLSREVFQELFQWPAHEQLLLGNA